MNPGRNDPCPCGSGKKYKKCCGAKGSLRTKSATPDPYAHALNLLERGDLMESLAVCQALLKANQKNADVLQLVGIIHHHLGNLDLSAEALRKALTLQPQNPWTQSNLAAVLVELGKYEEAVEHGRLATELAPNDPNAWNNFANALKEARVYDEAIAAYRNALAIFGNHPEVLCNLADTFEQMGQFDDAESLYKKAIAASPDSVRAYNQLGLLFRNRGRFELAREILERGIQQQSNDYDLWNNLGVIYKDLGDWESARNCFQKAVKIDPRHPGLLANLGSIAMIFCDFEEAGKHFQAALRLDSLNVDAITGMVEWLMCYERWSEAAELVDRAINLRPESAALFRARAKVLVTLQRNHEAVASAQKAMELSGGLLADRISLAHVYREVGKLELARKEYEQAITTYPDSSELYQYWADLEEMAGSLDRAQELAESAVNLEHPSVGVYILLARIARRRKDYDIALKWLDKIGEPENDAKQRRNYLFERANILDDAGRFDEAFTAYKTAGQARAATQGTGFDLAGLKDRYAQELKVYERDWLSGLPVYSESIGLQTFRPIFVVGFPRSGTTLIEQMLSSHSRILAGGELHFLGDVILKIESDLGSEVPYPACLGKLSKEKDQELVRSWRQHYLDRLQLEGHLTDDAHWVTDKMPLNMKHLPLIHMLFPDSPVIYLLRHPMDVCLSCMFASFADGHEWANNIKDAAGFVAATTELVETTKQRLEKIGDPVFQIRYEDLVEDPESWMRRLLEYVGESWEDGVLNFHTSSRVALTASYAQVRQPIYKSAVARYKKYRRHLDAEMNILAPVIKQYGYDSE